MQFLWFLTMIALKYEFKHIGIECSNTKRSTFAKKIGSCSVNEKNHQKGLFFKERYIPRKKHYLQYLKQCQIFCAIILLYHLILVNLYSIKEVSVMKQKRIQTINAILDQDLEALLKQTDIYEDLVNGRILCENCKKVIAIENIGIVLPDIQNDTMKLRFYCDDIDCIQKYYLENGRG